MSLHLKKLQQELQETIAGISGEEWNRCRPGKWSSSEVLEHLYLTYTGTLKGLSRISDAGQPKVTRPTLRQRIARFAVLRLEYMPNGREAPSFARPKGISAQVVRAEILTKITEMDDVIAGYEQRFGHSTLLLDHAILGPLTGEQWRKFHLVHGRHHLQQIRKAAATD